MLHTNQVPVLQRQPRLMVDFLGSIFSSSLNSRMTLLFVGFQSEALSEDSAWTSSAPPHKAYTSRTLPILQIQSCGHLHWMNSQSPSYYDQVNAVHYDYYPFSAKYFVKFGMLFQR